MVGSVIVYENRMGRLAKKRGTACRSNQFSKRQIPLKKATIYVIEPCSHFGKPVLF
jgi:pyrimidine deaminase RibD-like protein